MNQPSSCALTDWAARHLCSLIEFFLAFELATAFCLIEPTELPEFIATLLGFERYFGFSQTQHVSMLETCLPSAANQPAPRHWPKYAASPASPSSAFSDSSGQN